jgi:hypothetical protein
MVVYETPYRISNAGGNRITSKSLNIYLAVRFARRGFRGPMQQLALLQIHSLIQQRQIAALAC